MAKLLKPQEVLIIARNRGFWSTKGCLDLFPRRVLLGATANRLTQIVYALWGFVLLVWYRPRVLILGTSTKIVSWYSWLHWAGIFPKVKVITDKQYLPPAEVEAIDLAIVYSPGEIDQYEASLKSKFVFLHYPAKTELVTIAGNKITGDYIFCGGSNMRDHKTFLAAVRDLPVKVVVVTDKPLPVDIPANCQVFGRMPLNEYMNMMAGALFVVVPLLESKLPHGHCDIAGALSLGKPVITTVGASADRYLVEGENGLFVSPGDLVGYRRAIDRLWQDRVLLERMSDCAVEHAADFSYETFGRKLFLLCQQVVI